MPPGHFSAQARDVQPIRKFTRTPEAQEQIDNLRSPLAFVEYESAEAFAQRLNWAQVVDIAKACRRHLSENKSSAGRFLVVNVGPWQCVARKMFDDILLRVRGELVAANFQFSACGRSLVLKSVDRLGGDPDPDDRSDPPPRSSARMHPMMQYLRNLWRASQRLRTLNAPSTSYKITTSGVFASLGHHCINRALLAEDFVVASSTSHRRSPILDSGWIDQAHMTNTALGIDPRGAITATSLLKHYSLVHMRDLFGAQAPLGVNLRYLRFKGTNKVCAAILRDHAGTESRDIILIVSNLKSHLFYSDAVTSLVAAAIRHLKDDGAPKSPPIIRLYSRAANLTPKAASISCRIGQFMQVELQRSKAPKHSPKLDSALLEMSLGKQTERILLEYFDEALTRYVSGEPWKFSFTCHELRYALMHHDERPDMTFYLSSTWSPHINRKIE